MVVTKRDCTLPLPAGWPRRVRSAVVHAISLAHASMTATRGWAANSWNARLRLKEENDRLQQEIGLLRQELRIKDSRMAHIPAQRRPHYPPTERLAILELRAARGWSLAQTAARLLVTPATVAAWMGRLDEGGPDALVQIAQPVNRFPEFVGYLVRRLNVLCPAMGRVRIARVLARAGLHLGPTTVRRMLSAPRRSSPYPTREVAPRIITARKPNRLWHVDLTTVPIAAGHGLRGIQSPALRRCRAEVPGASLPGCGPSAPASGLGPGPAVRRPGVQALVPSPRYPAAVRGHRQVRQPGCDRALHPNDQVRVYEASDDDPLSPGPHGAGTGALLFLVQRPPATCAPRRRDPRRGLLSSPSRRPGAALRTTAAVAATFSLCVAPGSHPRSAWRPAGSRRPLSRWASAPAHRHGEARRSEAFD